MKKIRLTNVLFLLAVGCAAFSACKKEKLAVPAETIAPEPQLYWDNSSGSFTIGSLPLAMGDRGKTWYTVDAQGSANGMTATKSLACFYLSKNPETPGGAGYSVKEAYGKQLKLARLDYIPENVHQIVYDNDGNSIWFEFGEFRETITESQIVVTGISKVVGGTGRFARAVGEVQFAAVINGTSRSVTGSITNEGMLLY